MTTATDTVAGAAAHAPTTGEYITHHLGHNASAKQTAIVDFSIIHYDTIFWSVSMVSFMAYSVSTQPVKPRCPRTARISAA